MILRYTEFLAMTTKTGLEKKKNSEIGLREYICKSHTQKDMSKILKNSQNSTEKKS